MTARAGMAAGQHYAGQLGAPPFITDRRIQCSPDTADLFFTDARIDEAKALCWDCPRRDDCLRFAVAGHIGDGVWGGMTEEERNAWARGEPVPEYAPETSPAEPAICGKGHVLDDETLYYAPSRPTIRRCRACDRDRSARLQADRVAARERSESRAAA